MGRRKATAGAGGRARKGREIDVTDRQIDQLVYQLYGLTEEETQIVEASTGAAQKEATT